MKLQTDPVLKIESKIARRRERIARWDTEAGEVEAFWTGGPDYRAFCQGMARAAREKKELGPVVCRIPVQRTIDELRAVPGHPATG